MNLPGTLAEIVRYWLAKAEESLQSAKDGLSVGSSKLSVGLSGNSLPK